MHEAIREAFRVVVPLFEPPGSLSYRQGYDLARTPGLPVASLNGVNIPEAAYRYECGLPQVAPKKVPVPQIWREPMTDRWSFEEGGGGIDQRSRGHVVRDAYWRWNDPRPWLDLMLGRIGAKLGR